MICRAVRLACQTSSRLSSSLVALRARSGAASESIRTRSPAVSLAYSGMSSIRRYSGLVKRRLIGRYGDWLSGGSGSPACSGLIRMNPAPRSLALHAARSARSPRSPCPHDWRERSEYSWTAKPQDRSSGPGTTGSSPTGSSITGSSTRGSSITAATSTGTSTTGTSGPQFAGHGPLGHAGRPGRIRRLPQRVQDGVERPLAHLDLPPMPVPVAGGHPVGRGPPSGLVARHPSMIGPSGGAAHNPYAPSYLLVRQSLLDIGGPPGQKPARRPLCRRGRAAGGA